MDYPWYPFTQINAWVPVRRSHYKGERTRSINIEELFQYLEKEEDQSKYDRKFFYTPWVEEQYNIWVRSWKKLNGYWDQKSTHRPTKFRLLFPHIAEEDLRLLKKLGCKVNFSEGAKEKINNLAKTAFKRFNVTVATGEDELVISWNSPFNRWFYSLLMLFAEYMAIRAEDDPNSEYLPCLRQTGKRELRIPYWAGFRANYFWRIISEMHGKSDDFPLFDLNYSPFTPKTKKWDIKVKQNYELRPYQQEGIDRWIANRYFGTIQLPTGAGKTVVGIDAIRLLSERTLILVPSLALVDQWVDQISNFLGISPQKIGIFNGEKKAFKAYPIVISTYQLLSQYLQDFHAIMEENVGEVYRDKILVEDTIGYFTEKFGLLIADESHHIQADTFRYIALDLEIPRRLALSATIEKSIHSSLVVASMGPIVHKVNYGLLAREGYIAPIYYRKIFVPLTADEKGFINKKGKSSYGKVARGAVNKYIAIWKLLESPITSQSLVFTSRINHAKKIHRFLKDKGIESTLLTGETIMNEKDLTLLLDQFREGKINTLILVKMLNEGFDAPADTVIVASGTRNRREQIQRYGRATRPGKVAKLFELIIDPMELDYEEEISQARDITDVIEPHVQDLLLPLDEKREIDKVVDEIRINMYDKATNVKKEFIVQ